MSISVNKIMGDKSGKTFVGHYHDPNGYIKSADEAPEVPLGDACRRAIKICAGAMEKILREIEKSKD